MIPEKTPGGITLSIGGVKVGEMESLSYNPPADFEPIEFTRSISMEVTPTFIDKELMAEIMGVPEKLDIDVNSYPLGAPPRKLRSKSKRLRKKWAKKYPMNTTEYKNCTLMGVMEHATMD